MLVNHITLFNFDLTASTAAFVVHLDPMIHIARIGENVTFKCTVTGSSPFNVHARWYNKTHLTLNSSNLTEDNNILSLLVTIMTDEDYQDYICAVSNNNNTIFTATAVLSKLMHIQLL